MTLLRLIAFVVIALATLLPTIGRAATGSINGTVTAAATGLPVSGAVVTGSWLFLSPQKVETTTDANGHYELQINDLPDYGRAFIVVAKANDYLVIQAWPAMDCFGGAHDPYWYFCSGQSVQVAASQAVTAIDFSLHAGGVVQGHVTRSDNALPLSNATTSLGVTTDAQGFFKRASVPPGAYSLSVSAHGLITRFNDGQQCDAFVDCASISASTFNVAPNLTTTVDVILAPGVSISGSASVEGDPTAPRPPVRLYNESDAARPSVAGTYAYPSNAYEFAGLIARTYSIRFGNPDDTVFLSEYFDDIACPQDPCDLTNVTRFNTTPGQQITGIDAVVASRQKATGHVVDANTMTAIAGANVAAVKLQKMFPYNTFYWVSIAHTQTDVMGNFVLTELPPDVPFALRITAAEDFLGWQSPDVICDATNVFCASSVTPTYYPPYLLAQDESLEAGEIALAAGSHVTGRIATQGGVGIASAQLGIFVDDVPVPGGAAVDSDGNYASDALRAGTFKFVALAGTHAQMYDHVDCTGGINTCDLSLATPVLTTLSMTTPGVDFTLPDPDFVFASGFDN